MLPVTKENLSTEYREGGLELSRDYAREFWRGGGGEVCYESAAAKRGNCATSTGDQQGKIRSAVKQHSSTWPLTPLKISMR